MEVMMKTDTQVVHIRKMFDPMKMLAMLVLSLVAMMGLGVSGAVEAQANSTSNVVDLGKNNPTLNAVSAEINQISGEWLVAYSSDTGILAFDNQMYSTYTSVEKREFMSDALGYIKRSKLNDKVKNKLFNFIADQDTTSSAAIRNLKVDAQTDLATASSILKPFTGTISIILGVICLLVVLLLGVGTVLDIAYIALPMSRVLYTNNDERRPLLLSQEAYSSVVDGENSVGSGNYVSAIALYMRRRIIVLLCVGLAIIYLVTGQIFDIIGFFVDMFAPALEQGIN